MQRPGYDFSGGWFGASNLNRHEFIDWYEDVRAGTRRLIAMVPEDAFEFQAFKDGPTIEHLMRTFASLEDQYVRGVCTGDWSDPRSPWDSRKQVRDALSEDAGDSDLVDPCDEPETSEDILDRLDETHQCALDILADVTEEEFQKRWVTLPWGDEGTISRLLLGLVEREIHHRTELYLALQLFGIRMHPQMLWGP
jgi:hypothetical protein